VANEVVSYLEMCSREGTSLQRGMNFGLGGDHSVVLISVRPNAPYRDRLEDEGDTLIHGITMSCVETRVLIRKCRARDDGVPRGGSPTTTSPRAAEGRLRA
jgi:hypothetical protein